MIHSDPWVADAAARARQALTELNERTDDAGVIGVPPDAGAGCAADPYAYWTGRLSSVLANLVRAVENSNAVVPPM